MTTTTATTATTGTTATTATTAFVLLGGVPGAGKTTALRGLRRTHPGVRVLDPEPLRDGLRSVLPGWVAYRWYRPLVHTVHAVRVLACLLRGPGTAARAVVVHDPATRRRRRQLMARLAIRRGWRPVLVMIDVAREEALAGQRARGRVVRPRSFARHWRRWRAERPALQAGAEGWTGLRVVDRGSAHGTLALLLLDSPV